LNQLAAAHFVVSGRVQGVGFRPFVYRLAQRFDLTGWVQNTLGRVEIHVEGTPQHLADFATALVDEAPPLSQPSQANTCHRRLRIRHPAQHQRCTA
jgi:hydrogenase maturation protein HypF